MTATPTAPELRNPTSLYPSCQAPKISFTERGYLPGQTSARFYPNCKRVMLTLASHTLYTATRHHVAARLCGWVQCSVMELQAGVIVYRSE